ncbi:MAG: SpoIIE family protein phosphatase [Pontiellaceae bacterium]|nr:SpoIIE family protein phosphatase [Pontiellaceae bacterium]
MPRSFFNLNMLIGHTASVSAETTVGETYQLFSQHIYNYMAVHDDNNKLLGICAREEIGMLLGSMFGRALNETDPIRNHLMPAPLTIESGTALNVILKSVFSREAERFYDDVALTNSTGNFLGFIFVQDLVKLQHSMLEENIGKLEQKTAELNHKNQEMETDLIMARELQMALLPQQTVKLNSIHNRLVAHVHHRYYPSGLVGGDFFQVLELEDDYSGVFICDVMGHSIKSALVTGMISALLQERRSVAHNAGAFLTHMNNEMRYMLRNVSDIIFATAFYITINTNTGECSYASAGHPSPLHLCPASSILSELPFPPGSAGPALGLFDHIHYESEQIRLNPGESIIAYTDGILEVENDEHEEFGSERLMELIQNNLKRSADDLLDQLLSTARSFAHDGAFDDDVCLLSIRTDTEGILDNAMHNLANHNQERELCHSS